MTYGVVNLDPGFGHAEICDGIKLVNGIIPPPLIIGSPTKNTYINNQLKSWTDSTQNDHTLLHKLTTTQTLTVVNVVANSLLARTI